VRACLEFVQQGSELCTFKPNTCTQFTNNRERFCIEIQRKQRNACLTFTRSTWYFATCQSPFQENLEACEWAMRGSILHQFTSFDRRQEVTSTIPPPTQPPRLQPYGSIAVPTDTLGGGRFLADISVPRPRSAALGSKGNSSLLYNRT
jgi:hypothetical protein